MDLKLKFLILIFVCVINKVYSGALMLNSQNYETVLNSNELVFVNFHVNWCRFCQMLEPIYEEFADKAATEFAPGKVSIAKVDCDVETNIASQNQVNKYPTLKLFRHGVPIKREYRGARSQEAFLTYIREQLQDPIKVAKNQGEYSKVTFENSKRILTGFFPNDQTNSYKEFQKLASLLRDSCNFVAAIGDTSAILREHLEQITYRENLDQPEVRYEGDLNQHETLYAWANEKCTPLVREITFENAEELTEEGLPFLILFHRPDDMESVKVFENEVKRQLAHYKNTINAVYADGLKFSHPLHHLGKSASDLPVLAIDSFRHMYLFPDYSKLTHGDSLTKFVIDLHSGKLHREFHNGPDPVTQVANVQIDLNGNHLPNIPDNQNKIVNNQKISTPPESQFIKLAPSRERYSIKYDEL